jgi:glutathione S-transferase
MAQQTSEASPQPVKQMCVKGMALNQGGSLARGDCPFCARAALHLHELGASEWEEHFIDLADKPDWFLSISPEGKVPAAVLSSGDTVSDSAAIVQRVEQEVGKSLPQPNEAQQQLEEGFLPAFVNYLKGNQDDSALIDKLSQITDYLNNRSDGPFLAGSHPGASDCSLAPKLDAMRIALHAHKGWSIPEHLSGTIRSYLDAWKARDSWKRSQYSDQAVIEGWRKHLP